MKAVLEVRRMLYHTGTHLSSRNLEPWYANDEAR